MELLLIIRVLLRRWYLVLIPPLVASALLLPGLLRQSATATGGYATTIRYTAAQVLEAIPARDGDYQDVWLASELTVNAFSEWISSMRFADEVSRVLMQQGEDIPATSLQGRFITDNARSVGVIYISWTDAQALRHIAEAAIEVLETRTAAYFPQLGGVPAQVRLLDVPVVTATPPPLTNRFGPLLQIGVALLAGVLLAFLADYLDPMVRRREQVELMDVPVIATIPRE